MQIEAEESQPAASSRGGRGRGGYRGGRGGTSRGRGRGGFNKRSEFDGGDDDDEIYSAPSKGPKRAQQKQEDLKMDEDNYPALN